MTVYAIPGFGCTGRLFERIRLPDHEIKHLDWPDPKAEYDLKQYALQFLPQIDQSQPFALLGVSFGGMICAELAEVTNPEKVILISSSKNRSELPWPVRLLKYVPLHTLFSRNALKKIALNSGWIIGFKKEQKPDVKQMVNEMPLHYFKNCIGYIAGWTRKSNSKEIFHIHGNADRLLWYGKIKNPDLTIEKGSHAMIVYRADEISNALTKILNS
jgi:pimeloyl-ACP methyl ester carboxylesterase